MLFDRVRRAKVNAANYRETEKANIVGKQDNKMAM